jgi:hypothetical protein
MRSRTKIPQMPPPSWCHVALKATLTLESKSATFEVLYVFGGDKPRARIELTAVVLDVDGNFIV